VAGVALMTLGWLWWRARFPWAPQLFAWQAWHLATSTVTLRGRRGAWRHRPPLCVAGAALTALGWLWWRAWFPFDAVGAAAVCVAGVALGAFGAVGTAAVGMAGVALGGIDRHFAWQAWRFAT